MMKQAAFNSRLLAEVDRLTEENARLRNNIQRLREALYFYALPDDWHWDDEYETWIYTEGFKPFPWMEAREALDGEGEDG